MIAKATRGTKLGSCTGGTKIGANKRTKIKGI